MIFHVSCSLGYTLYEASTFLFSLKCIETPGQRILHESMTVSPHVEAEDFSIGNGMNRFSRLKTVSLGAFQIHYEAEVRTTPKRVAVDTLLSDSPGNLSPQAIYYLFPSRYCQSDSFRQRAQNLFGHLILSHEIAQGVCDWIHEHIAYVEGSSNESSSALETFEQKQGVCRDFAHLGIAFCRSMNLPARYATCYAYQLEPSDFHACFEVFIDGDWYIFDATKLVPLNGLVRIATGRDAADAAVGTIFGNPDLTHTFAHCQCLDPGFSPVSCVDLAAHREVMVLL